MSTDRKGGMWTLPIALGVASGIGLVVGLFSDGGFGDLAGNVLLALPVAACAWWGWLKR
ncbi:hypothetical protein [Roseateles asaccharophilus]|uniref:Uncharacterized protein n=1 Tax=Roseateles asaccharophilus TaxID=582607 RepID=A0ABU2A8W2_9BURK|nr:hypothetical protein [Roseateles asaccharophilus]MDR7332478.1 hypothetical protein [Roseateles asaccharophilus]